MSHPRSHLVAHSTRPNSPLKTGKSSANEQPNVPPAVPAPPRLGPHLRSGGWPAPARRKKENSLVSCWPLPPHGEGGAFPPRSFQTSYYLPNLNRAPFRFLLSFVRSIVPPAITCLCRSPTKKKYEHDEFHPGSLSPCQNKNAIGKHVRAP